MSEPQSSKLESLPWKILAIVGSVASVAGLAFVINEVVTSGKRLQVVLNSSSSLVSNSFNGTRELEISFNGEAIDNAIIYNLLIKNNGSDPIGSNDFEDKPLKISFPEVEKVFSPEIVNSSPKNLANDIDFETKENAIELEPLLLNSGDELYIEVTGITSNYDVQSQTIECYCRIRGIKEISCLNEPENVFFL